MNDQLTPEQMNAMVGMSNMTPDQSKATLGHSNTIMSKLIGGAESLLPTAGAVVGGIGGATLGGLAGIETGPGALGTAYAGGVAGAGLGAASGEAAKEKLQGQSLDPAGIAIQGGENAAFEAIGGPILSMGGKALSAVRAPIIKAGGKLASKIGEAFGAKTFEEGVGAAAKTPVSLATSRIAATADMLTKNELAQEAARVTPKGTLLPSQTEKRVGELLAGKTSSNPVNTLKTVTNEIASRGQKVEQFLGENARPISNEEDLSMFKTARDSAAKYLTPAQLKGYDHAVNQFESELRGMGNMNTGTYYKALKNFEANVTEHLPKGQEALLSDTGTGQLAGAKTVRKVVRDMIGVKHPQFKQDMFDLASLYDAKDNVSAMVASKAKGSTTFGKRHPIITKGAKVLGGGAVGALGAGAVYEGGKEILGQ